MSTILGLPLANLDHTLFHKVPAQIGGVRVQPIHNSQELRYQLDDTPEQDRLLIVTYLQNPSQLEEVVSLTKKFEELPIMGLWMGERSPRQKKVFTPTDLINFSRDLGVNPIRQGQLLTAIRNNVIQDPEAPQKTACQHKRWKTSEILQHPEALKQIKLLVKTPLRNSKLSDLEDRTLKSRFVFQEAGGIGHDLEGMLTELILQRNADPQQIETPLEKKSSAHEYTLFGGKRSKKSRTSKKSRKSKKGSKGRPSYQKRIQQLRKEHKKATPLDQEFNNSGDFQALLNKSPEDLSKADLAKINSHPTVKNLYISIYESYFNSAGISFQSLME